MVAFWPRKALPEAVVAQGGSGGCYREIKRDMLVPVQVTGLQDSVFKGWIGVFVYKIIEFC